MLSHKIVPNISVDCVIFGFDFQKLNVLLVERDMKDEKTGKMLISDHTLAGYHIFEDEDIDSAAARILKDLTGLDNIFLEQFGTFGQLDRVTGEKDQMWLKYINQGFAERIVTVGYLALIDNTKVTLKLSDRDVRWVPVNEVDGMEMAFDHKNIFYKALEALQRKVKVEPIAFELLPDYFTLSQLQKLYEALLGASFDKRNFRKKVAQMHYVIPLKKKQKGVAHKPAQYYLFSREVYEKTRKGKISFII
ncbi:MAG TPA: NUDIX domain-containing protein [Bacteroidales bacterium]|nr:NUDIX domain-containing protein [Bacteroidales bacterium]